ncbi:hypothetical protein MMC08_003760 [Hypocenomyce scalaris]|nr:hypothetical protein [Hypocenomyce scalaris]
MAAAYLTVNLGEDISRDLLLGSQSITSSKSLLPSGIMAFIDSTMPHIWLPLEACLEFESAFGLVYDSATDLYLVNDTLHKALLAQNPNVTFQLSADTDANSGASLDIVLPYGAIDLKGQLHVHERTFLQEAYLIADYDRSTFTIAQTIFPAASVAANLASILPPTNSTSISAPTHHSNAAYAAIAAAIIPIALLAIGLVIYRRRRHQRRSAEKMTDGVYVSVGGRDELDNTGLQKPHELDINASRAEIDGEERPKPELEGSGGPEGAHGKPGLEGNGGEDGPHGKYELTGSRVRVPEMEGNQRDWCHELPGSAPSF